MAVRGDILDVFGSTDTTPIRIEFFDDEIESLRRFDPETQRWTELSPSSPEPDIRYGSGAALIDGAMVVTHGFRFAGRFDDTWAFERGWQDVSPGGGPRPSKRCLIRTPYLRSSKRMILFGGQSDESAFLGDTWAYNPRTRRWRELDIRGPGRRNVYAADATRDKIFLFGGETADGASDQTWAFDGEQWLLLDPDGRPPKARSGIEGTIADGHLYVFGGRDGSRFFDDLWRLSLPA